MTWTLELGAKIQSDGSCGFRVWAPYAKKVAVCLYPEKRVLPMQAAEHGYFELKAPGVPANTDYRFLLDGELERPDPASRHQPAGVHGPSRIVDPAAFQWNDHGWKGLPLDELSIYELHVGTFSPQGSFDAVADRLGYLVDLGISAVELMPVAEFPGERNWGYDGVCSFAPQSSYGGPEGLKRLVDACHRAGLAVVLDVVLNHLGPEGNYLRDFGPYFSDRYRTPWGEALNFDGPMSDPVRRHFLENALYWLDEYHVDALRLDAVHAIYDFGARHFLAELGERFHSLAQTLGRQAHLIAESDLNDTRVIRPRSEGGWELDAQWSDDFHHALHARVTGKSHGYFADFGRVADLGKALTEGFVYDWRYSRFRQRHHGNSAADQPGKRLVVCTQNHDQVANASRGQRIAALVSERRQRVSAAIWACAPNLLMLFQGQEYGEVAPFHYFTSHTDPELVKAVRRGRQEELAGFGRPEEFADPQAKSTFDACKLDWKLIEREPHGGLLRYHRRLLALRQRLPALSNPRKDLTRVWTREAPPTLVLERQAPGNNTVLLVCNLGDETESVPLIDLGGHWQLELTSLDEHVEIPSSKPRATHRVDLPRELQLDRPSDLPLPGWTVAIYSGPARER